MRAVIGAGLNYKDISNASPDMRKIVQATTTALRAIGEESKLNEIRVRKYGIASDPASTKSENGEGA